MHVGKKVMTLLAIVAGAGGAICGSALAQTQAVQTAQIENSAIPVRIGALVKGPVSDIDRNKSEKPSWMFRGPHMSTVTPRSCDWWGTSIGRVAARF